MTTSTALAPRTVEAELVDDQVLVGYVHVRVLRSPFSLEAEDLEIPEGLTLAAIADEVRLDEWAGATATIDGARVPREWWARVRPRAGHYVFLRALPAGGGGDDNKGIFQIILGVIMIVVGVVLAVFGYGIGTPLITMGIGMLVGGITSLLMPPPQMPKIKENAGGTLDQPVFSITGARNQANLYGTVPEVLGRHLIYPPYGALPYTELVGSDQYLRLLFVLKGPVAIESLKIGETLVANLPDVELEIRQGLPGDTPVTLYTNTVVQEELSVSLGDGVQSIRTTEPDTDEISVDFVWPQGLVQFDLQGNKLHAAATIEVLYRPTSGGAWTNVGGAFVDNRAATIRHGIRWTVIRDQYDVAVRQLDGGAELNADSRAPIFNIAVWTTIRSIKSVPPISAAMISAGLAVIAMRIKATDRLNGVIDSLNLIATSIVPDYDAGTLSWITRATRNPASLYRHVLQGNGNARALPDPRLDLTAIEAWHGDCVTTERTFDFVVEQKSTVKMIADQICAIGRATVGTVDGRFGVVRDVPQSIPVGLYNQRNTRNYRGTKAFRDLPHAVRAQFISPDDQWQLGERFVYWDGYNADGSGGLIAASKFEAVQFIGCTEPELVHKLARYHLAAAYLRPEIHEFEVDVEHLQNTRGDRIAFSHDVPLFGQGGGRVKSITVNGSGQATTVTVDEPMTMTAGSYGIKYRRSSDGVIVARQVVTVAGTFSTFTFSSAVPVGSNPAPDDLFSFGTLTSETIDGIIIRIEMLRDLAARIVMVDYAPGVYNADTGPVPPYDPQITLPPELQIPPAPRPDGLASRGISAFRTVQGTLGATATLHFTIPQTTVPIVGARVEGGYRLSGAAIPWTPATPVSAEFQEIVYAPLEAGRTYDLRVQTVSATNRASGWVYITGVEIPNPPIGTFYDLIPTPNGYAAVIAGQIPRFGPPIVTGLRLANPVTDNPNDTDFFGRDAKWIWNAVTLNPGVGPAEDDMTQDASIRDYVVQIWTGGVLRRWGVYTQTPGYTYSWEMNVEDHRPNGPSRSIEIRVWARSHDGSVSREPAILVVQNPAPDMSQIAPVVTPLVDAAIADWTAFSPTDHDFESYLVRVSPINPPLEEFDRRSPVQRSVIIPDLAHGTTYYLQVVPFDAFGEGIGSVIVEIIPKSAAEVFRFFQRDIQVTGIVFSFDEATNVISWTAGTLADVDDDNNIRTTAITAGSATWTGGTLFISWLLGAGHFDAIADPVAAIVVGRATMAVYNGGRNMVVTFGKATVHGQDILANTIGAAQLIANQVLITGSAQIAHAIIDSFHLKDGTIDNVHIKNEAVDNSKIKKATITFAEIAFAAIKGFNLGEGEIDSVHIKFAAIDEAKIKNLAVKNAAIDNLAINGRTVTPGSITTSLRQNVNIAVASVNGQNLVTFTHNLGFIPLVTWQWIHQNGTFCTWLYECDETKFTVALSHPSAPIFAIGTLVFKYW